MNIYFVRNKEGKYLNDTLIGDARWRGRDEATIYKGPVQARSGGDTAFGLRAAPEDFTIEVVDVTKGEEAVAILNQLQSAANLGDFVYDVRDREGKGWDGPRVVAWGNASERALKLLGIKLKWNLPPESE
jgi:hypothetical protein